MLPAYQILRLTRALPLLIILLALTRTNATAQDTDIFILSVFEKSPGDTGDTIGFVSLSETFRYSEHPDSSFLPDLAELPEDSAANYDRIVVTDSIRKQLLQANNLRPNDRVFVYQYAKNVLFSYPVKELLLVAYLSPYVYEWPYKQEDYMLGFQFSQKQLHGLTSFDEQALVTLGKRHPFELGKMRNISWKPIAANDLPTNAAALKNTPTEYQVLNEWRTVWQKLVSAAPHHRQNAFPTHLPERRKHPTGRTQLPIRRHPIQKPTTRNHGLHLGIIRLPHHPIHRTR